MAKINQKNIRNFCIIAHIDHGKSTLADRIIEKTGLLTSREMQEQVLDNMDLERERGITIKAQTVRIVYKANDGEEYIFNLIDTPGHVDFNYEVSRALAACDGAILVVDAAQGIEAQTLANVYLALDHDLDVFPVINKIDLPSAEPQRVIDEIEDVIGIEAQDAPLISAKNGINIEEVLEQIVTKIPAPTGDENAPLQALIFDSLYDSYKGVIIFCRIKEGKVKRGTKIRMMATGAVEEVVEVGYFGAGQFIPCEELSAGMVGYITASIKNVKDTRVGDTVTDNDNPCAEPLPGYKKVNPMVYCGLYPADGAKYQDLREALEKLQLNDASLQFEPETSIALGFGFRCGFLGLLHLEIIQERLEREYNLDLVTTAPGVIYKVHKTNGEVIDLTNPSNMPDPSEIEYMDVIPCIFVDSGQHLFGPFLPVSADQRLNQQPGGGRTFDVGHRHQPRVRRVRQIADAGGHGQIVLLQNLGIDQDRPLLGGDGRVKCRVLRQGFRLKRQILKHMVGLLGAVQIKGTHGHHVRLNIGALCQQLSAQLRGSEGLKDVFPLIAASVQSALHGLDGLVVRVGVDHHLPLLLLAARQHSSRAQPACGRNRKRFFHSSHHFVPPAICFKIRPAPAGRHLASAPLRSVARKRNRALAARFVASIRMDRTKISLYLV